MKEKASDIKLVSLYSTIKNSVLAFTIKLHEIDNHGTRTSDFRVWSHFLWISLSY